MILDDKLELAGNCVKRAELLYMSNNFLNLRRDDEFLLECGELFRDYLTCHERVSCRNVAFITDLYKKVLSYACLLVSSGLMSRLEADSLLSYSEVADVFRTNFTALSSDLDLVIKELKKSN